MSNSTITLIDRVFGYTPSDAAATIFIIIDIIIIAGVLYTIHKHYVEHAAQHVQQQQQQQQQQQMGKSVSYHDQHEDTHVTHMTEKSLDRRGVRLLWIVAITSAVLIVGLGLRIQMNVNPVLMTFIVEQAFLIISPNALAFVNYSLLGIILRVSEINDSSLAKGPFYLRSKWVARLFLASDVFSFFIQSSSTPMLTNTDPAIQKNGQSMMVGGLILQLVFFSMFIAITIYVDRKPIYKNTRPSAMKSLFTLLYFTIAMLYIRSLYRLIEFADGHAGSIAKMEWLFYVADQIPVSACMAAYILLSPVRALQFAQAEMTLLQASSHSNVPEITVVVQKSVSAPIDMIAPRGTSFSSSYPLLD